LKIIIIQSVDSDIHQCNCSCDVLSAFQLHTLSMSVSQQDCYGNTTKNKLRVVDVWKR